MPVLGLDIGTQSVKAVVLDEELRRRGAGAVGYTYECPSPGWAEQDPARWLMALRPAIGAALSAAGLGPHDVKAVAVCGQLDGCIAVDETGGALAPAIIWMDRRATPELAGIDPAAVAGCCGLVLDATHMAAKMAWMRHHVPDIGRAALWHQPVSYVVAQLTGEHVISHSLASTTMLYGLSSRGWDDALLAIFGATAEELPRIADETAVAPMSSRGAEITGLAPGTPVAVGTGDDFSNPLGCGVYEPGTVAVSLGTGETVSALAERLLLDRDGLVETHAYPGGLYHLGNPGWLSGGAVRWARGVLGHPTDAAFVALAADAPAGCDGLVFIPALSGAMAPRWVPEARGSFIGLTTSHGPAHLARAVLEGTAFAMRDIIDRLAALGVRTDKLRLMGGGARSSLWCQIRADVSGRRVEVQTQADASAIGAALIAAVGVGSAPSIAWAASQLCPILDEVAPATTFAAAYEQAYRSYRAAFEALEPHWAAIRKG